MVGNMVKEFYNENSFFRYKLNHYALEIHRFGFSNACLFSQTGNSIIDLKFVGRRKPEVACLTVGREEENFHLSSFCFGLPTSDFGQKNDIYRN